MDETSAADNVQPTVQESSVEPSEPAAIPTVVDSTAQPPPEPMAVAPKKRGRPQGSKDKAQRTRRPAVQVRIEPLEVSQPKQQQAQPSDPEPLAKPQREPTEPVVIEKLMIEPKSPRTELREHTQHVMRLRRELKQKENEEYYQSITAKWMTWPL